MKTIYFLILSIFIPNLLFAQAYSSVEKLDPEYLNWYNLDPEEDEVMGVSVEKTYDYIQSKNKKSKDTIIVAVIDSGVDIYHEDLEGKIWINEDEIPDNGIDDDNNGYIDDVYGWNFIGGKDGKNIHQENFEYTRILRDYEEGDSLYKVAEKLYEEEYEKQKMTLENLERFTNIYYAAKEAIKIETDIEVSSIEDLEEVKSNEPHVIQAKEFLKQRYESGLTEASLENYINHTKDYIDYFLNPEFDVRHIAGDDPYDLEDLDYGNPDVIGPRSEHGTSVAGVIAAVRNNQLGIDGIASDVKIMAVRSTPMGDERDKDVALAIRYAVDNGADIINMSFGKAISPQKAFVDEAVKYAEERDVLLVHGSGNSGQNIDTVKSYPSDKYLNGEEAGNFLNVGANGLLLDQELPATFSNYGEKHVDLFAPGVKIVSLDSSNTYGMNDGTSLAAPVVSGVAALILSYYPELTSQELIEILMESVYKVKKPKKVLVPNLESPDGEKVKFKELAKSGGIVNAYDAFLEAEKDQE